MFISIESDRVYDLIYRSNKDSRFYGIATHKLKITRNVTPRCKGQKLFYKIFNFIYYKYGKRYTARLVADYIYLWLDIICAIIKIHFFYMYAWLTCKNSVNFSKFLSKSICYKLLIIVKLIKDVVCPLRNYFTTAKLLLSHILSK